MAKHVKRMGLTLLELLLVIVIIGLLLGMMMPATRQVREAARRTTCMNNMKQLSLAALNYESAHLELPMGVGVKNQDGVLQANPVSGFVSLLPFVDQGYLYDEIANPSVISGTEYPAFEASLSDAGYTPWTQENNALFCPSSFRSTKTKFGRTSYAFSIGDVARNVSEQETLRGAYGYFKANRIDQVTDGTSNTVGMIEIGSNMAESTNGGCLANGKAAWLDNPEQVFSSVKNDAYASGAKLIDRGSHWADGRAGVGLANTILPFNSPSFQVQGSPTADGVYSAGSMHTGGGNVVMLDGSTHFVSKNIDTGDMSTATLTVEQMAADAPTPHGVWGAAGTIRSGEEFSGFN